MTTLENGKGTQVLVEFPQKPGVQSVSVDATDVIEKSAEALDKAMDTIHHMAERVTTTIKELAESPSEVQVEFGVKFDAAAGAVIAKLGAEASLTVSLKWEFQQQIEGKR